MTPTVSILMSVYNNARDLPEALESLRKQTFSDFEVIVIDDASTDESLEILQRLASQDSRFKIVRREHQGLTKNLNQAFSLSQGQFIARMDGDDISLPMRLEKQITFFETHPDIAVLGCYFDKIDENGKQISTQKDLPLNNPEIRKQLVKMNPFCHGAVMMRRDAFLGYREAFHVTQDYDLWLRMPASMQFAIIPEVLYQHRRSLGSISQERYLAQQQMANLARELFRQRHRLQQPDDLEDSNTFGEQKRVVKDYLLRDVKRNAKKYCSDLYRIGKRQETAKNYAGARQSYLQAMRLNPLYVKAYVKWLTSFVKQ